MIDTGKLPPKKGRSSKKKWKLCFIKDTERKLWTTTKWKSLETNLNYFNLNRKSWKAIQWRVLSNKSAMRRIKRRRRLARIFRSINRAILDKTARFPKFHDSSRSREQAARFLTRKSTTWRSTNFSTFSCVGWDLHKRAEYRQKSAEYLFVRFVRS